MTVIIRCCAKCDAIFDAPLKEVNRGNGKFCSATCAANFGKPIGLSQTATRRRARALWIRRHGGRLPMCRKCGSPADVHHIDGDDLNNSPRNHDTLCRSCHTSLEDTLHPRRRKRAA
jgi:hypothetical protein